MTELIDNKIKFISRELSIMHQHNIAMFYVTLPSVHKPPHESEEGHMKSKGTHEMLQA